MVVIVRNVCCWFCMFNENWFLKRNLEDYIRYVELIVYIFYSSSYYCFVLDSVNFYGVC